MQLKSILSEGSLQDTKQSNKGVRGAERLELLQQSDLHVGAEQHSRVC